MKFVIQRVTEGSVTVENKIIGQIGKGFVVLIGVGHEDTTDIADGIRLRALVSFTELVTTNSSKLSVLIVSLPFSSFLTGM